MIYFAHPGHDHATQATNFNGITVSLVGAAVVIAVIAIIAVAIRSKKPQSQEDDEQ